jgi:hypothetical protein
MGSSEPLVHFYDLSGPKPWSPACWCTRYALNYKQIPYTTTKISYPAIKPKCDELFSGAEGVEATVPIVEVLGQNYKALNNSTPIANLLNERFTEENGYRHLKDVEKVDTYENEIMTLGRSILMWIMNDVYENALDPSDGSKEYFKRTREASTKTPMKDVMEIIGGGEAKILEEIKALWSSLRERMRRDDGSGERKSVYSLSKDPTSHLNL